MKKIIVTVLLLTAIGSLEVMAQKKKTATNTTSNPAIIAEDAVIKAQNFRLIGPFRGGRAAAGVGAYTDPNTFFMGSTGGGVWKQRMRVPIGKIFLMDILVAPLAPLPLHLPMSLSYMLEKEKTLCEAM